jgi:hypothetical protein
MVTKKLTGPTYPMLGPNPLGPQRSVPPPKGARWLTSNQVLARYGGRSQMWLHRKLLNDPEFPRPAYDGRYRIFPVDELDAYDAALLAAREGDQAA